ncbi:DUF2834 domain-containing protein [Larkinella terrae]|uniref:DUF2834 domain-containing protein n=1 Tax=Larkinella terrae TaxID=2025311 RepID=A0A7K0EU49_9BACT|nr:DUF2834 domain-containing protein [Larkinella terrae]MRS65292.1 DUF2834 domain-containing protein [Larkinella terrae]
MNQKPLTPIMLFYLFCSLAGLVIPWYYNIQHIRYGDTPFTVAAWLRAGMATPLTRSITTDFLIGTTPVLIWMVREGYRLKMKHIWLYVLLTFLIAFAFTCPLFLFFRERKLRTNAGLPTSE